MIRDKIFRVGGGWVKGTGFHLYVCVSTFRYMLLSVRIRLRLNKRNEQMSLVGNSFDLHPTKLSTKDHSKFGTHMIKSDWKMNIHKSNDLPRR